MPDYSFSIYKGDSEARRVGPSQPTGKVGDMMGCVLQIPPFKQPASGDSIVVARVGTADSDVLLEEVLSDSDQSDTRALWFKVPKTIQTGVYECRFYTSTTTSVAPRVLYTSSSTFALRGSEAVRLEVVSATTNDKKKTWAVKYSVKTAKSGLRLVSPTVRLLRLVPRSSGKPKRVVLAELPLGAKSLSATVKLPAKVFDVLPAFVNSQRTAYPCCSDWQEPYLFEVAFVLGGLSIKTSADFTKPDCSVPDWFTRCSTQPA